MSKKTICLPLILFSFFSFVSAQNLTSKVTSKSFRKGNVIICVGYGAPFIPSNIFSNDPSWFYTPSNYTSNQNSTSTSNTPIGPFYGKVEYALSDIIGIQANFAYVDYKSVTTVTQQNVYNLIYSHTDYTKKLISYSGIVRLNFHFTSNLEKIDVFTGVGMGMRSATSTYSITTTPATQYTTNNYSQIVPTNFPFGFEMTAGARYYFTPTVGAYAEVGFAKSPFQLGLVLKF